MIMREVSSTTHYLLSLKRKHILAMRLSVHPGHCGFWQKLPCISSPCISIHIHTYPYISTHIHAYACISMNMHAYASTFMHICACACISMHIREYPCISMHMHAYPCISVRVHAYPRISKANCQGGNSIDYSIIPKKEYDFYSLFNYYRVVD